MLVAMMKRKKSMQTDAPEEFQKQILQEIKKLEEVPSEEELDLLVKQLLKVELPVWRRNFWLPKWTDRKEETIPSKTQYLEDLARCRRNGKIERGREKLAVKCGAS